MKTVTTYDTTAVVLAILEPPIGQSTIRVTVNASHGQRSGEFRLLGVVSNAADALTLFDELYDRELCGASAWRAWLEADGRIVRVVVSDGELRDPSAPHAVEWTVESAA